MSGALLVGIAGSCTGTTVPVIGEIIVGRDLASSGIMFSLERVDVYD